MRTAKFYVFCSLSATKLQGMVAVGDVVVVVVVRQSAGHGGRWWSKGGINVIVVLRQSAGYDAMRCIKCYSF